MPSRSPSPAPAPPVAHAPGARATALTNVFSEALTHTFGACNYANFSSCFPTPATQVPESLEGLWRDFVRRLEGQCRSEFDTILAERNVVSSLNTLDRILRDAARRKERASDEGKGDGSEGQVPIHTLPPSTLYEMHLSPFITGESETIQGKLDETKSANAELMKSIAAQRQEMAERLAGLESVVKDLEGSAASLSGGKETEGLRGEAGGFDAVSMAME